VSGFFFGDSSVVGCIFLGGVNKTNGKKLVDMDLKDFIYHYARYCRVNVNAALLVENWLDMEYDEKYCDYLQEYIKLRKIFLNDVKISANPDEAVLLLQKSTIEEVYSDLYRLMINGLKNRKSISEKKEETFHERLKKAAPLPATGTGNDVNFNFVSELRKIEEEEY